MLKDICFFPCRDRRFSDCMLQVAFVCAYIRCVKKEIRLFPLSVAACMHACMHVSMYVYIALVFPSRLAGREEGSFHDLSLVSPSVPGGAPIIALLLSLIS